jgi:acyl-CoA synthetase (AMP-forming)/AMP-acid ligase II
MNFNIKQTPTSIDNQTLVQTLQKRAADSPRKTAFLAIQDLKQDGEWISFGELDQKAKEIAATLQGFTSPQEKAILIFPSGLDFISALFGCFYAGLIAVPVSPPEPGHLERDLPKLKEIIVDAQANVILTNSFYFSLSGYFYLLDAKNGSIQWLSTEKEGLASEYDFHPLPIQDQIYAISEYQPRTTEAPRGAILSHENLLSNLTVYESTFGFNEGAVNLSWLPPYYGIGLVEGALQSVYSGCLTIIVPTQLIIDDPLDWIRLISKYEVNITGAPDDVYDQCASHISRCNTDYFRLGKWTTAYTTSNRLDKDMINNFYEIFKIHGFLRDAFIPFPMMAPG